MKANSWSRDHAARLKTTPAEILEAARRGWLPEQIEGVASKHHLEGPSPPLDGIPDWIDHKMLKGSRALLRHSQRHIGKPGPQSRLVCPI